MNGNVGHTGKHPAPLPKARRRLPGGGDEEQRRQCADAATSAEASLETPSAAASALHVTVALHGLCDMKFVNLAEWPEFFDEMCEDVEQECSRHGYVETVWADRSATMGSVWLRFATPGQAKACQAAMHDKWFAGRQIEAELHRSDVWRVSRGPAAAVAAAAAAGGAGSGSPGASAATVAA